MSQLKKIYWQWENNVLKNILSLDFTFQEYVVSFIMFFFDKFSKANPFFPVVDVYTNIIILIMRNMGYFSINENDPEKEWMS